MPNVNEISTAVYRLLKADTLLTGMGTIYKGSKRPVNARNPTLTVGIRNFARGEGEGIWMGDIVVTAYVDILGDGAPDMELLENLVSRIHDTLSDAEIELEGAQALPLIESGNSGPEWESAHKREVYQESVFGLVFMKF